MKKFFTLLFVVCVFQSFAQVRISGTVTNPGSDDASIKGLNRFDIKKVKLENGKFEFNLPLPTGYYFLAFGNDSSTIFVEDGYDITVTVDHTNYDQTIKFAGKGSKPSNYLHQRDRMYDEETKELESFYSSDPKEFKKNIQRIKKKNEDLLKTYTVSESFQKIELTNIEYQYYFNMHQFSSFLDFYFEKNVEQPEAFKKELVDMNYDQEDAYTLYPYYRYLSESNWEDRIEAESTFFSMRNVMDKIKTRELKMSMLINSFYKISKSEEKSEAYYKLIKDLLGSKNEFSKMALKEYEKVKDLQKGKPSPLFTYEDINGKSVSLTDLKGKYVYIDVWATWCKPCIAQMPDLKKLEKDYHDKDIVFVSISLDKEKAKEKWKTMVRKKDLGGVQLIADNAFESEFIDKFGISSIPSFILIDPQGNIVQRRSSKPSTDKIRETFDSLLQK